MALPFVAIYVLNLNSFQIGVLASATLAPVVVLGPFFGSVVDRYPRKLVMVWCDLIRVVLIGILPLLIAFDAATFTALIIVGGSVAVLSSIFNLAQESVLPALLPDAHLGYGNSRIEATESAAEISAPGVAGWLVGVAGSAAALVVDALSYLISAMFLVGVRTDRGEAPSAEPSGDDGSAEVESSTVPADVKTGFRLLWTNPVLRPVSISYAALVLFAQLQMAVYVVFLVRDVHLGAGAIGLIFSASAVVGMLAALLAGRLVANHGAGPLTVIGQSLTVAGAVLLALVGGSVWQAGVTMLLAESFFAIGMSLYGVGSRTLNQTQTTSATRGRVLGSAKVLNGVASSVAGLLGGSIATIFDLRTALVAGAAGMVLSLVLVIRPAVWSVTSATQA